MLIAQKLLAAGLLACSLVVVVEKINNCENLPECFLLQRKHHHQ